jgi:hypothetical protein
VVVGGAGSAGLGGSGAVSSFVPVGGAGGAVGFRAGRGVFLRFTVFLLTSSFSSS